MPTPMPGQPTARADPHAANARAHVGGGRTPLSLCVDHSFSVDLPPSHPQAQALFVPAGTVCAQDCSQHPSTAKASNDGTGPLIASLSRCGPAPQKITPLDRLGAADAEGRGSEVGRGGTRNTLPASLGGSYCSPPAPVVVVFGFLPGLSCLVLFILPIPACSVGPHPQRGGGGREGSCPPRRCNITQVGSTWAENGYLKVWACGNYAFWVFGVSSSRRNSRQKRPSDGMASLRASFPPSVLCSLNYVFFTAWPPVRQADRRGFLETKSHRLAVGGSTPRVSDRGEVGWFTDDGTEPSSIARQRWEGDGKSCVFWLSMVLIGPKQHHVIFVIVFVPRRTVPTHVFGLPHLHLPPRPLPPRQNKLAGRPDKIDKML